MNDPQTRGSRVFRELTGHDPKTVLAIDPHHWQLARFVLWNEAVAAGGEETETYQVLHVSAPGIAELPDGRAW